MKHKRKVQPPTSFQLQSIKPWLEPQASKSNQSPLNNGAARRSNALSRENSSWSTLCDNQHGESSNPDQPNQDAIKPVASGSRVRSTEPTSGPVPQAFWNNNRPGDVVRASVQRDTTTRRQPRPPSRQCLRRDRRGRQHPHPHTFNEKGALIAPFASDLNGASQFTHPSGLVGV